MIEDITSLFCFIDDFVKNVIKNYIYAIHTTKIRKPTGVLGLTNSEIITIKAMYHSSEFNNFKSFYQYLKRE